MKKVGKLLLVVLFFNLMTFAVAKAESTSSQNVVYSVKESMSLDQYRTSKEYPTTLTKSFNAYTGLANASTGEQLIIGEIKKGLENLQTTINLNQYIQYFKYRTDAKIPLEYYFDTLYEYPELFYPNLSVQCSYYYNSSTNEITSYNLVVTYSNDNTTINTMKTKFNSKVQEIKNNYVSKATTALEKEYVIHDYIIQNTKYDYDNYYNNTVPNISHTAYGSLVNGIAVCDGYSKAARLFLRDSGIEAGIVESQEMNHAWNYVKMDGYYYFLDLTWDDPDYKGDYVDYTYFNATTAEMKSGTNPHVWDEAGYPASTNTKFSFLRNGNEYKTLGNKLYYSDYVNKNYYIYSMDLQGQNKTLISNKATSKFEVYKNNLYRISYNSSENLYNVNRLNLTDKSEKAIFTINGSIQNMYKTGANLTIDYTEGGVSKTKVLSIDFKEDVNADGLISIVDLATIAEVYNAKSGTAEYKAIYDFNSDSIIDIYDLVKIALQL
ncbi:dockerin type I domain-containing protein [Clostridium sp. SHJSY1]|uniref:transglutaminase domain-containing protein n=1 Tax=Clostridium sp. SHJSY1 TaxID=2942483 RepID=UPI002874C0CA|nr:transglutaminase domain-containing protein [Clostridium sp. SHJSY1]MDS0525616.1 dockerin type I domain-containing protein [Clostridium sp. SHJSY1]